MRAAVAVRRAAGHEPSADELSVSLEHLEQTLDDLSEGVARMSGVIEDQDATSGGLAWRLQTLRHALSAAHHICSRARAILPGSGTGEAMPEAEEPSAMRPPRLTALGPKASGRTARHGPAGRGDMGAHAH